MFCFKLLVKFDNIVIYLCKQHELSLCRHNMNVVFNLWVTTHKWALEGAAMTWSSKGRLLPKDWKGDTVYWWTININKCFASHFVYMVMSIGLYHVVECWCISVSLCLSHFLSLWTGQCLSYWYQVLFTTFLHLLCSNEDESTWLSGA